MTMQHDGAAEDMPQLFTQLRQSLELCDELKATFLLRFAFKSKLTLLPLYPLPLSGSRGSRNSHAYFACLELLAGIQLPNEDQQQVYSEGKCC